MSSKQSTKSNQANKREEISVQQYRTDQFQQPQQLESHVPSTVVEQIASSHNSNTPAPNSPPKQQSQTKSPNTSKQAASSSSVKKQSKSQRSSLQQQQEDQQKIRKELILQFKISQLQKICTTLTSANEKLLDKIEELQEENDQYKGRISVLEKKNQYQEDNSREQSNQFAQSLNQSRNQNQSREQYQNGGNQSYREGENNQRGQQQGEISEQDQETKLLEQQVADIEKMIKEYRQELTKAEELNKTIKDTFSQTITSLQQQLKQAQQQLQQTQSINTQLQQQLIELQQKNQSLEQQIQSILASNPMNQTSQHYPQDHTARNRTDSRSSQYLTPINQRHPYNRNMRPSYYEEEYSQQLTPFDSSVQLELQKLIQKLVKELEHERSVKKRMTQEMKRIQKDLLESEKQIMLKNKKIYELQMNLLKGQKNHLFTQGNTVLSNSQIQLINQGKNLNEVRNQDRTNKYSIFSPGRQDQARRTYNSPNTREISPRIRYKYLQQQRQRINTSAVNYSPSHRTPPVSESYVKPKDYPVSRNPNISQSPSSAQTKHLQTFSLLQLTNEPTITLSIKEKLHICLKLVEFYEQKIYQYKNYNLLMLENVLVTNFNRIKPGLIKIRVEEHKKSEEGRNPRLRKNSKDDIADGPQKVIWNLGFLLNSLLLDVPTKEDDLGISSSEKSILSLIDNILDNRNLSKEVFPEIKEHLEAALSERTQ